MPIQRRPAGPVEEQLSIIGTLLALPFPERETRTEAPRGWGGPGFHIAVLRQSRDFWDPPGPEAFTEAEEELEAALKELVTALTGRLGEPGTVDLFPYLGIYDDTGNADEPAEPLDLAPDLDAVPEPLASLRNLAGSLHVWPVPSAGRWLGVTVGQADREFPYELLAAVGEAATLPRGAARVTPAPGSRPSPAPAAPASPGSAPRTAR
ncbi:hypothetical protein [Streptomyces sp. NPDC050145]|uniref:hypothetical protein n=1 Tax=Streptomyces sp. NPDC050145 TaxID=3365602 RepID=UPI0037A03A7B